MGIGKGIQSYLAAKIIGEEVSSLVARITRVKQRMHNMVVRVDVGNEVDADW